MRDNETETETETEISMAESDLSSKVRGSKWSLKGMTALVTGGTRGIGSSSSSFVIQIKTLLFEFGFVD